MKSILITIALLVSGLAYGQTAEEYFNRALDKEELEDYRGAITDYSKAIGLNPEVNVGVASYLNRGLCKTKSEDYRGAIVDFSKAIELKPNFAEAYYERGIAKEKLEDYGGAIADFTQTIELNPFIVTAYYNRGLMYIILGQIDEGCMDLSKAGELGYYQAYDMIKKYCN